MEYKWFVIRTKSNHEQIVAKDLMLRNFDYVLPIMNVNNRVKPLFPGYVFVKQNDTPCNQLQFIRGSRGLLIYNGKPGYLRNSEVESIMGISQKAQEIIFHEKIELGTPVKIMSGPFIGLLGELIEHNGHHHFTVCTNILGRSVSVKMQNVQFIVLNS